MASVREELSPLGALADAAAGRQSCEKALDPAARAVYTGLLTMLKPSTSARPEVAAEPLSMLHVVERLRVTFHALSNQHPALFAHAQSDALPCFMRWETEDSAGALRVRMTPASGGESEIFYLRKPAKGVELLGAQDGERTLVFGRGLRAALAEPRLDEARAWLRWARPVLDAHARLRDALTHQRSVVEGGRNASDGSPPARVGIRIAAISQILASGGGSDASGSLVSFPGGIPSASRNSQVVAEGGWNASGNTARVAGAVRMPSTAIEWPPHGLQAVDVDPAVTTTSSPLKCASVRATAASTDASFTMSISLDAKGQPVWHYAPSSPDFAAALGRLIAELHAVNKEAAGGAGVPVTSAQDVRAKWHADFEQIRREFAIAAHLAAGFQAWLADDALWPTSTAFDHGELYAAHVLIDTPARIVGVLDWTTAKVGDPAIDFTYQHMMGPDAFEATVAAYRAAGGIEHPHLAERCAALTAAAPLVYALFALQSGEPQHRALAAAQPNPEG